MIKNVDSQISSKPGHRAEWTLEELLAGIQLDNIHREVDAGPAVGNETYSDDSLPD